MNQAATAGVLNDRSRATEATAHSADRSRISASEWFTPGRFGLLLVLALFAAFPKVTLGLHSFFYRDYGVLAYPCAYFQQQSFWRGELPLWNPLSHCGVPFLAQWGTNLYPLSLIYLLFPLPWSLSYFCLLHLALGGLGMYALANRWIGHRLAASLAGLVFVFNGATFSCLIWPNYAAALGWMPWVVLWVERSWREGGRWLAIGAVVAALQMLAGVPELLMFTWILLGVLWLNDVWQSPSRLKLVLRFLGVILLVAGLAAVQLWPFFDLLAQSQRDRSFGTMKWAMPGWGWANLLVPLFHCFQTPQGPWFQEGQEFLNSYYLGTGVLVLAVFAAWRVPQRRVWLLAGLAALSLVLALGDQGMLYTWIRKVFPLIGVGRYPVKFVLLAAFLVPLLAAWALHHLDVGAERNETDRRRLLALGLSVLAAMAVVLWFAKQYPFEYDQWPATWQNAAGRTVALVLFLGAVLLWPRLISRPKQIALGVALLAVVVIDARTHLETPSLPVSVLAPGVWQQGHTLSPPRLGESRAMISTAAEKKLLGSMVREQEKDFFGKRLAEWSNLNLLDGIPKVNGASTLQVREQKQVEQLLYGPTNYLAQGLVDFLAVSRVTSPDNAVEWTARTNYCPWVTGGQQPMFASAEATLRALASPDFDPRQVVYLPTESRALVTVTNMASCRILSSKFSPQSMEIEVEAEAPSWVVISQTYYPAWRAYVDGQPATLVRANHAFQAVQVPARRHQVRLVYRDQKLLLGGIISGLTLLVCGVVFWRGARRGPSLIRTELPLRN